MKIKKSIRTFHTINPISLKFSPNGSQALSVGGGKIKLWNIQTGQLLQSFEQDGLWPATSARFGADGNTILVNSYREDGFLDHAISVFTRAGEKTGEFDFHKISQSADAISPNGRFLVHAYLGENLTLWDITTGEKINELKGHSDRVYSFAFSPDSRHVITGSEDTTMRMWDVATGQELLIFDEHRDTVISLAFSPNGRYILSGSHDDTMKLWSIK